MGFPSILARESINQYPINFIIVLTLKLPLLSPRTAKGQRLGSPPPLARSNERGFRSVQQRNFESGRPYHPEETSTSSWE